MPNTLDILRADADSAHERWQFETDPERRRDLRVEYYAALQAVTVEERRQRHPLPDGYRSIPECYQ